MNTPDALQWFLDSFSDNPNVGARQLQEARLDVARLVQRVEDLEVHANHVEDDAREARSERDEAVGLLRRWVVNRSCGFTVSAEHDLTTWSGTCAFLSRLDAGKGGR